MARRAAVICPEHGEVTALLSTMLIDDEGDALHGSYRFTCEADGAVVEKPLTDEIRDILRGAGVRTVDEVVASEAVALRDDESIWDALGVQAE